MTDNTNRIFILRAIDYSDSSIIYDKAKKIKSSRTYFEHFIDSLDTNNVPLFLKDLIPVVKKLYDTYDITQSKKELKTGEILDFTEEVIERIGFVNKKYQKDNTSCPRILL